MQNFPCRSDHFGIVEILAQKNGYLEPCGRTIDLKRYADLHPVCSVSSMGATPILNLPSLCRFRAPRQRKIRAFIVPKDRIARISIVANLKRATSQRTRREIFYGVTNSFRRPHK